MLNQCGWANGNLVTEERKFAFDKETKFYSKCRASEPWTVRTYTGKQSSKQVSSWIYLTVYDVGGPMFMSILDSPYDDAEPGNIDSFNFEMPCIDEPYRVKIWSPDTISGAPWFLNKVEIIRYDNFMVEFTVNSWMNELHQETFCLELFADGWQGNTAEKRICLIDEDMLHHHDSTILDY
ncbi:hypothetical protein ScPMuIL_003463 [Solemya velum]